MYRCGICNKPFIFFQEISVNSDTYGGYSTFVTPCCGSHNYSEVTQHSFATFSGGSTGTIRQLNWNEAVELILNWASDFQKENNE
jgi:hypothetical protein